MRIFSSGIESSLESFLRQRYMLYIDPVTLITFLTLLFDELNLKSQVILTCQRMIFQLDISPSLCEQ